MTGQKWGRTMLLQCPDCNGPVSKSAKACPNCGHVMKGRWSLAKILFAIPICAVIWQFTYGGLLPDRTDNSGATPITAASDTGRAPAYKSDFHTTLYKMHEPISYAKGQVIVDSVSVSNKAVG